MSDDKKCCASENHQKMVLATEGQPFNHLVPSNKNLASSWLTSLFQRTNGENFSGWNEQLKYIGMPVGGIGCGQLYLGGDGQLWHWDIFKSNYRREPDHGLRLDAMTQGGHYAKPVVQGGEYNCWNGVDLVQGFALQLKSGDKALVRTLNHHDFPEVTFRGEYPIGRVSYVDKALPATVELEAFSPFIPLNARDSSLPATILSFRITNTSNQRLEAELLGWLQNAIAPYDKDNSFGQRRNSLSVTKNRVAILNTVEPLPGDTVARVKQHHGYGSMALTLLHGDDDSTAEISSALDLNNMEQTSGLFHQLTGLNQQPQDKPMDQQLIGGLKASVRLAPGESKTIDYAISWYFPDYHEIDAAPGELSEIPGFHERRRHYAPWFDSAEQVAAYLAENKQRLLGDTRLWNTSWYNSTLPHWLLDRTFVTIDCMATQTFHWFDDGRPFGWEGVDCCPGTCTHVWHYAQGLGRIFPEIERAFREIVDYGVGFNTEDGMIYRRGDWNPNAAVDGHAGTIMRVYREHQMSVDDEFLKRLWPRIKLSVEHLIAQDEGQTGLLRGEQSHTLDAEWYGPMAWISGLYLVALAAGETMAQEVGDHDFARACRQIIERGKHAIVNELFNGEYFIHKPDPDKPESMRSGRGCHIDQVLGQGWAHQVGLGRVIPKPETESALNSLWKYNFAPDAGQYAIDHVAIEAAFRCYAMPGEAGLLMCTWPHGGAMEAIPGNKLRSKDNPEIWSGPGGYFNECMNGFEYQVAGHMIAEGEADSDLVMRGLAITRAIHDRYGADKRNPYNEIECSDHYARSMASYGVFTSICGFQYHGPKGHIGFAPKLSPDNFKAPFTAAEGWGSFEQKYPGSSWLKSLFRRTNDSVFSAALTLAHGRLRIATLGLKLPADTKLKTVLVDGCPVDFDLMGSALTVKFDVPIVLQAKKKLDILVQV